MRTKIPKGVRQLALTPDKVMRLWKDFEAIPGLFDDYSQGDYKLFLSRIQARDSIWLETEDESGVLYATNIMPGLSASGHFVFFDRRLRGKEQLVMDCVRYIMAGADLKKLNVYLPSYAGSARHFAERLGFKHEGVLRRWSYSRGKLYDMHLYGITFEEAFDGSATNLPNREPGEGLGQRSERVVPEPARPGDTEPGRTGDTSEHETDAGDNEKNGSRYGSILLGHDPNRGDEQHAGSGSATTRQKS